MISFGKSLDRNTIQDERFFTYLLLNRLINYNQKKKGDFEMLSIENDLNYHHWANVRLLEHINQLESEVFFKEVKSIFPSLAVVFEHIYQVDSLWINRMIGEHAPQFEEVKFSNPFMAIQYFEKNHQKLIELGTKEGIISYQNTKGEMYQNDIQQILSHLMNHGTYHRGNASAMLHQMREKSISTDYIYFLRMK